jgi:hypothetical protein
VQPWATDPPRQLSGPAFTRTSHPDLQSPLSQQTTTTAIQRTMPFTAVDHAGVVFNPPDRFPLLASLCHTAI